MLNALGVLLLIGNWRLGGSFYFVFQRFSIGKKEQIKKRDQEAVGEDSDRTGRRVVWIAEVVCFYEEKMFYD